jgi:Ser/Thr protein kinase RdoA (MazF antagonist)
VPGIGVVEDTQLALAARHLGKLHVALKQWQARPNKSEQKDGFKERLIRLQTLRIDTLPRFSNPIVAELRSSLCDYLASGTRQLLDRLKTIDLDLRPSQWCWRDIWRDHLLFNHAVETGIPEISGLLDPDAFGFSHPIFDVVRLLGTLLLPNDSRWSIAVDTYNAAEPPTPLDLHALKSIDDASTVLSAVQWLTWLNEGTFDPVVPPAAAVARIRELTQKLTVLVAADYGTRWDA